MMSTSGFSCPWSFLDGSAVVPPKSYAAVTATPAIPIANLPLPVIHEGRTTITISEEGYQSRLEKCKHMLLGRLHSSANVKPYSPSELHRKLGLVWGEIGHWRLIPMGKGYYSFSFSSDAARFLVLEKGAIALKPRIFRFMRWTPNFSPAHQKNTNAQVWVNFWDLGLEFWEPITLFEIANGIGVPVKVD
ncbi:uncharacterized protein LOC121052602 [Rosa chinensis]|uniref:uncharacterized protein LOC121052602 n=1 Tax=Rosa chinensis TaxID=74649 RepID=UPI001AD94B2A|nr:uncharacterized protein LOC121052602 [Rosa chinensis]XP_040373878.1 uncharacterized protein LOC121052602 [Rosa chinensis]